MDAPREPVPEPFNAPDPLHESSAELREEPFAAPPETETSSAAGASFYGSMPLPAPPAPDRKPKKREKRRLLAFGAVILLLCVLVSFVSGAAGSFLVLRLSSVFSQVASPPEENTHMPEPDNFAAPPAQTQPAFTAAAPENDAPPAVPEQSAAAQTPVTEAQVPAAQEQTKTKTKGEIYADAVNSIVCVEAEGSRSVQNMFGFGTARRVRSGGSGFFCTADGYIVTNYHVIEGMDTVSVTAYSGERYAVTVRGFDEANDIAVLKAEGSFPPVTLGESASLAVGDDILVIGNALGELSYTFTDGVVSYLSRSVTAENGRTIRMFQTNAAINEGNSGGPVYNAEGLVVGIASAKYASETIEGLGFCIPIDDVKEKISDIIRFGYVTGNPLLGVSVQTVTASLSLRYSLPTGCYVVAAEEGLCAAGAGISRGDVLLSADGYTLSACEDLAAVLSGKHAGDPLSLTVSRAGETFSVTVTLDEYRPAAPRTEYSNVFDY